MTLEVQCPAKINTFLAVGPKDERGYHPLRTVFQAVSLYDTLRISVADAPTFSCSVPLPEDNTVTKALRLVSEALVVPPLKIELEKNIPMQSGLGGGSSDAAGLLRCLPQIIGHQIPKPLLEDIALSVGADVPFFLLGGRAKGEGYGERLTPLPAPETTWMCIVQPSATCSTAEAYARLDDLDYRWRDFPPDGELYNDFERVAPCECLHLKEELLALGASGALLTGSGSAVFGVFDSEAAAHVAAEQVDAPFKIVVRSLER